MNLPDRYAAMAARAALYHGTANWGYAGIVLIVLWFGFMIMFTSLFNLWSMSPAVAVDPTLIDTFYEGSTPAAVGWSLATFGIYTWLLLMLMYGLHSLGIRALLGATGPACREFARVSLYLLPIYAITVLPSIFLPEAQQQYSLSQWLPLMLPLLPLLFVQISAEEFVFRGYLQSHLAALSNHPLVWIGIPSALFGLIHYDPLSPSYSAWAYVFWAGALGFVCADLTARSGTLGPALAVHFVNNIGAMFILAADDWLYGAALFVWPTNGEAWVPWIPYEALFLGTVWLAARLAIRR